MFRPHSIPAPIALGLGLLGILAGAAPGRDADGPDCARRIQDLGDAPEGVPAYPGTAPGVIGRFPTCLAATPAGDQDLPGGLPCGAPFPIGTAPGATGFVRHVQFGQGNYWLGCYADTAGGALGIDSEPDGKTNSPATGTSACSPEMAADCVEPFEGGFDQDECYADGSDAGVRRKVGVRACPYAIDGFELEIYNCGGVREIALNVLADWNKDGDWNDQHMCVWDAHALCSSEWVYKNFGLTIVPGCNRFDLDIGIGIPTTDVWMRVTVSDGAVSDDFPWAGSAPGELYGGETEDYQIDVTQVTAADPSTWGRVKRLYRN